jgi:hypothetical protein
MQLPAATGAPGESATLLGNAASDGPASAGQEAHTAPELGKTRVTQSPRCLLP